METKANYTLIGAFTLAGLLGLLALFLWFARIELDRQFAYYDVRFSSVSGLSTASDVRFAGLPVGQVVDVRLSPDRDGTITVRLEIDAETPVRADSLATIESLGVTGVSYVAISAGDTEAPLLVGEGTREVPEIEAGRSTLQTLTEDAPELVEETLRVVREIGNIFSGENADRIDRIIANVEIASNDFSTAITGFAGVADTIDTFALQIDRFNTTLDALTAELAVVLASADETLHSVTALADEATVIVQNATGVVSNVQAVTGEAQRYIAEDLTEATARAQTLIASMSDEVARIGAETSAMLAAMEATGTTANARLAEAEGTLAQVDALIATLDSAGAAVGAAAARLDGLIETEGAPLLAETRVAVAEATAAITEIRTVAETNLPAVLTDIETGVAGMRGVVEQVGADLTAASGDIGGLVAEASATLTVVTQTFEDANGTLEAINGAMATGTRTLAAAETAIAGADDLIRGDLGALIADLRDSVDGLDAAVAAVSEDIPAVTADLRATSAAALEAFTGVERLVASAEPGVQDFVTNALPLFGRLAQETRSLISNLDQLTRQIEQSPTRFLLDRELPEFNR